MTTLLADTLTAAVVCPAAPPGVQVYADQTEPLLEVYRSRGLLIEVDGQGEIAEVSERIFAALDAHGDRRTAEYAR